MRIKKTNNSNFNVSISAFEASARQLVKDLNKLQSKIKDATGEDLNLLLLDENTLIDSLIGEAVLKLNLDKTAALKLVNKDIIFRSLWSELTSLKLVSDRQYNIKLITLVDYKKESYSVSYKRIEAEVENKVYSTISDKKDIKIVEEINKSLETVLKYFPECKNGLYLALKKTVDSDFKMTSNSLRYVKR